MSRIERLLERCLEAINQEAETVLAADIRAALSALPVVDAEQVRVLADAWLSRYRYRDLEGRETYNPTLLACSEELRVLLPASAELADALAALGEAAVEYSVALDSWVTDGGLDDARRANDAFRALRSAALAYAKVRKEAS